MWYNVYCSQLMPQSDCYQLQPDCEALSSKKCPARNFTNYFWHVWVVSATSPYIAQIFVFQLYFYLSWNNILKMFFSSIFNIKMAMWKFTEVFKNMHRDRRTITVQSNKIVNWKDWCWSWNSNTLATSCEELIHWKRPWCWEGLGAGGEGDNRGWDGWMASPIRWTWVWVNSGRWWWTGRPGVLRFMGSQRVDRTEQLNWTEAILDPSYGKNQMNFWPTQY